MGGYGAWKAALEGNENFGAAAALSGALDIAGQPGKTQEGKSQGAGVLEWDLRKPGVCERFLQ